MKRILSLDGFRFIMCCTIFIGHCTWLNDYKYGYIHQIFFQNSSLALDYFFMLSGFGMYLNYCNTKHIFGGGKLLKKAYIVYVFSMLLYLPLVILGYVKIKSFVVLFLLNLTLLQSLIPSTSFSHGINGVCWFLSSLFCILCLSPILLKLIQKKLVASLVLFSILYGFLYEIDIRYNGEVFTLFSYNVALDLGSTPYLNFYIFFLGMVLGKLYINYGGVFVNNVKWIPYVAVAYYFSRISLLNVTNACFALRMVDIMVALGLIYVLATRKEKITKIFSNRVLVNISKYTLHIYLLHYPVIAYLEYFVKAKGDIFGEFSWLLYLIFCIVGTTCVVQFYLICEKYKKLISSYFCKY